ncbi:NUDIX hydrolase [Flavisphingomonas formosensis]|uniref:NUDIX hydrolase n=1 Tax=Flavisphingomonas formosensis TaxID=861534 RepID=UPI0012F76B37|nr:NUDIX hydrolase [Sphingomonas formosensis]
MSDGPIPAATLILMRPRHGLPPELLMVERSSAMVFAAGAMVFPGGRIDPGDHALAAAEAKRTGIDRDDAAARIAAIRETVEETGVAIAIEPQPDAALVGHLRAALRDGSDFGALLAAHGLSLEIGRLAPFARWCPPPRLEKRTFDTRFYLAEAMHMTEAMPDGGESIRAIWMSAADAIADSDAGHHRVIFPTRRNLERLAQFSTLAEAAAQAEAIGITTITPFVEQRNGEQWLCISDGLGYPITGEPLATATRG